MIGPSQKNKIGMFDMPNRNMVDISFCPRLYVMTFELWAHVVRDIVVVLGACSISKKKKKIVSWPFGLLNYK